MAANFGSEVKRSRRNHPAAKQGAQTMTAEAWHRRHAIQIAAALPETREDALIVLDLARELIESFLYRRPEPPGGERVRGLVVSLKPAPVEGGLS
jgi:hypothetical protein